MWKSVFIVSSIVFCAYVAECSAYDDFDCPKANGLFEDPFQCDKYYECKNGQATEKMCPDGLVFNSRKRSHNKCDQPFNVDCGDRKELQPANPEGVCLRQNGFFPHPDSSICNIFYNCVDGQEMEMACASGLHFDLKTGTCVWAENAGRPDCNNNANKKLKDGFQCPTEYEQMNKDGQMISHPTYPHPDDCTKFYICLNRVEPRQGACDAGLVYNEVIERCDDPDNVPGCKNLKVGVPVN